MAYASTDELAGALDLRKTDENEPLLADCLNAAADEIDGFLVDAYEWVHKAIEAKHPPTLLVRVNVNRAVEWYKAPAAYAGGVGMGETGTMTAPRSGFERHAAALTPLRRRWGVA